MRHARWQELANAPEAINQPVPLTTHLANGLESSADAIRLLKSVQERHPDDVGANVCLAEKLMASNPPQVSEAVRFYTAAVAVRPSNSSLNAKLAVALQRMERPDEAHAAIRRATEQGSDKAAAHFAAGCALLVPKFIDEAIAQFRSAASLVPENAAVRNNLGVALHRAGRHSDAVVEFREAIRLRPNWALFYCNLGNALKDAGEMEQAMTAYAKAIEVDPMCSEARWSMFFAKQSPSSTRPEQTEGDHAFGTNTIMTLDFEQADNPGQRPDFLTGLTIAQQVEEFLFRYTTWTILSRDDAAELLLTEN
jgi:Flp pilus assembly protein TadD